MAVAARPKPTTRSKQPHASQQRARSFKRPLVLLGLLAALIVCFYLSGGVTRLSNHWANNAIERRDFKAAHAWLIRSRQLDPTNAETYFLAARVARHEGQPELMERSLSMAATLGFDADRVELERQLSLAQRGFLEGVEAALNDRLMKADPDSAQICDAYANGLTIASRFVDAMAVLGAWHRDVPHDPVPTYRIGRIQEYLHESDHAKKSYRAAIALDADYYPAYYSLARLLLDANEVAEAAKHYERCLTMDNPAAAKVGLGMALAKSGDAERAKRLLAEVVELDKETIRLSYAAVGGQVERFVAAAELGKLHLNEGQYAEALHVLDMALEENPRDLAARYSRALALRALKRDEEANEEMEHVETQKNALQKVNVLRNQANRHPEDFKSRIELGQLLVEHESVRTGLFWLRSALLSGSNSAEVHQALAEFYEAHRHESAEYPQLAKVHRGKALELASAEQSTKSDAP